MKRYLILSLIILASPWSHLAPASAKPKIDKRIYLSQRDIDTPREQKLFKNLKSLVKFKKSKKDRFTLKVIPNLADYTVDYVRLFEGTDKRMMVEYNALKAICQLEASIDLTIIDSAGDTVLSTTEAYRAIGKGSYLGFIAEDDHRSKAFNKAIDDGIAGVAGPLMDRILAAIRSYYETKGKPLDAVRVTNNADAIEQFPSLRPDLKQLMKDNTGHYPAFPSDLVRERLDMIVAFLGRDIRDFVRRGVTEKSEKTVVVYTDDIYQDIAVKLGPFHNKTSEHIDLTQLKAALTLSLDRSEAFKLAGEDSAFSLGVDIVSRTENGERSFSVILYLIAEASSEVVWKMQL